MFDFSHAPLSRDDLASVAAWAVTSVPRHLSARPLRVRIVAVALVPLFVAAPFAGGAAVLASAAVVALAVALRAYALVTYLRAPTPAQPAAPDVLPSITVLLPLKNETSVAGDLVDAVLALDYPSSLIEVIALVEDGDPDTYEVLRERMPTGWRIIVLPKGEVQNKPRACTVGLGLARGDIVVIFDGEDRPEPDQAQKAVAALSLDPNCGVVQARLACDHAGPDGALLARFWALEYATLFGAIQPALARLGLPFLLGGTSNWFRRTALESVGGWDAYNITEDADLGIRLARAGWTSSVIDSTTGEEAPVGLAQWLGQRSRWFLGFAVTTAVHFSRPDRLVAELGLAGALAIVAQLPATLLCAVLHPLGLGLILTLNASGPLAALGVAGYALSITLHAVVARRTGMPVWIALTMPFYWLLQPAALALAYVDLVRDPARWRKTRHGLARRPETRCQRRTAAEPARARDEVPDKPPSSAVPPARSDVTAASAPSRITSPREELL